MSRSAKGKDAFLSRLLKYIPTEIVGAYLVIQGLVPARAADERLNYLLLLIVSAALFVITPLYLWRVQKVDNIAQLTVSAISFAVWIYSLGGPFVHWHMQKPVIGSIVLVLWTLIIPIIIKPKPA